MKFAASQPYHRTVASISRDFSLFLALPSAQKLTFANAALLLPVVWVCLRVAGLPRCRAWLRRWPAGRSRTLTTEQMQELGRLVNAAAIRTIGPAHCLTRSLLLDWLLQRHGVSSHLRIGVRVTQGRLCAHAWVEFEGLPLNDRADVALEFAPFADLLPLEAFEA